MQPYLAALLTALSVLTIQGALLLYKLLIPFVALAAVSSVINRRLHLPPLSLFAIGSLLSEVLTITVSFEVGSASPSTFH